MYESKRKGGEIGLTAGETLVKLQSVINDFINWQRQSATTVLQGASEYCGLYQIRKL